MKEEVKDQINDELFEVIVGEDRSGSKSRSKPLYELANGTFLEEIFDMLDSQKLKKEITDAFKPSSFFMDLSGYQ